MADRKGVPHLTTDFATHLPGSAVQATIQEACGSLAPQARATQKPPTCAPHMSCDGAHPPRAAPQLIAVACCGVALTFLVI
mmetsp:Transcript_403/g.755  ORF Transcript_403/g.755 Transcript_403/m.755 type:complete len:81 (-) Transcript_403:405-647(-)